MSKLKKYLSGKTVVLVGPASTLKDQKMGRLIDAHDVVVRINHAWPLPDEYKQDIGTRTDILYHNLNPKKQRFTKPDIAQMKDEGIKWIVFTHPARASRYIERMRRFQKVNKRVIKLRAVPIAVKKQLRPRVGSANGGLIAIADLLRFPIGRLYVTGFSFYKTGYLDYPSYKPEFIQNALNHHNQRRHRAYLAHLLKKDGRLDVDPYIAHLLQPYLNKKRTKRRGKKRK